MKTTYFRSKELVIAACALMHDKQFSKAGAMLLRASKMPDFGQMVEAMNNDQQALLSASVAGSSRARRTEPLSALASIVEGMADDVNDVEDMLEDLDYSGSNEIDEPDEIGVDAPDAAGDLSMEDEPEGQPDVASDGMSAKARLERAEANLRALHGSGRK